MKNAKNSDIPRTVPCGLRTVLYFFSFCLKEPVVFGYTGKINPLMALFRTLKEFYICSLHIPIARIQSGPTCKLNNVLWPYWISDKHKKANFVNDHIRNLLVKLSNCSVV